MAFVNEYISKENIEKYGIFGIMNKFDEIKKEDEKYLKLKWVLDRERFGFVMQGELLTKI